MALTLVRLSLLREAFDLVLARWPDEILPGDKTFHLGGGCNMRALNVTHASVESWVVDSTFDEHIEPIIAGVEHYLFTSIHGALRDLTRLSKSDIDFLAFVSRMNGHPDFRVVPDEMH